MDSSKRFSNRMPARALRRTALALGIAAAGISAGASAISLDTGNPDLEVKWDNTIRLNAGWRVEEIDDAIGDNFQYDESDYKFEEGDMIAQRPTCTPSSTSSGAATTARALSVAGWYDRYDDTDDAQNRRSSRTRRAAPTCRAATATRSTRA